MALYFCLMTFFPVNISLFLFHDYIIVSHNVLKQLHMSSTMIEPGFSAKFVVRIPRFCLLEEEKWWSLSPNRTSNITCINRLINTKSIQEQIALPRPGVSLQQTKCLTYYPELFVAERYLTRRSSFICSKSFWPIVWCFHGVI